MEEKEIKYTKDKKSSITFRTSKTKKADFKEAVDNVSNSLNSHMDDTIEKAKLRKTMNDVTNNDGN